MGENIKTAEQFVKDHKHWFELYLYKKTTLDERPKGKDYNLINANLRYANLQDADLRFAQLFKADLSYANLEDAKLQQADLSYANLNHANLTNVSLYNANLEGAILTSSDLTNSRLCDAYLTNAYLIGANLIETDLMDAKIDVKWKNYISKENVKYFDHIIWIESESDSEESKDKIMNKTAEEFVKDHQEWLKFWHNDEAILDERPNGKEYDLRAANLEGAILTYALLRDAKLRDTNLRNAKLEGADFTNADLSYAYLYNANFKNAELCYAKLEGADLSFANLSYANLYKADLSSANLTGGELNKTHLEGAKLESAHFYNTKIDIKWKDYITTQECSGKINIQWLEAEDKTEESQGKVMNSKVMNKIDKTAEQFLTDHYDWLALYEDGGATWEERPKGKDYNLEYAYFRYTNLEYADLSHANLTNANLRGANLFYANLNNAKLHSSLLTNADLHYADLTNANLMGANLFYVNLNNANLTNTDLFSATIPIKWKDYIQSQNVIGFGAIRWLGNQNPSANPNSENKDDIRFEEVSDKDLSPRVLSIPIEKIPVIMDVMNGLGKVEEFLISQGIAKDEARETITILCERRLKEFHTGN